MLIKGRFLAGEKVWFQRTLLGPFHSAIVSGEQSSSFGHVALLAGGSLVQAQLRLVYFDLPETDAYRAALVAQSVAARPLHDLVKGTPQAWDGFTVRDSPQWARYAAAERQSSLTFRAMMVAARSLERRRRISPAP